MVSGGHHPPRNPAPASGPGRLSKRTDGPAQKLLVAPGAAYGDRQALMNQERTAPLAQTPAAPNISVPAPQGGPQAGVSGPPQLPPFGGATARPDEPVTHGVDIGPGGGSDVLPVPPASTPQRGDGAVAALFRRLSATAATGDLATLYQAALTRGV